LDHAKNLAWRPPVAAFVSQVAGSMPTLRLWTSEGVFLPDVQCNDTFLLLTSNSLYNVRRHDSWTFSYWRPQFLNV